MKVGRVRYHSVFLDDRIYQKQTEVKTFENKKSVNRNNKAEKSQSVLMCAQVQEIHLLKRAAEEVSIDLTETSHAF